jgi:catechol 2,3-dioxygenase-like lactoylglutathione lyase family enzyme
MPTFRSLVPMLQTLDMERTVAWYESVLGFRRVGQHGNEWCSLRRDNVSIMFMNNAHLGAPHATAT